MRKKGWAILLAGIAIVVVAGYFLSQAAVAAQSGPKAGSGSNAGDKKTVGTWDVKEMATGDMDRSAVKGIQKTINIPPAAFISDGYAEGGFYKSFAYGYLEGLGGALCAPVIFPKGAKKILYVDYYVWDESGGAGYLAMYDSYTWSNYVKMLVGGATFYNSNWTRYRGYPIDATIYPNDVWYVTFYGSSGGYVYLKGVVVTYQ